jgi:hypothetical protein
VRARAVITSGPGPDSDSDSDSDSDPLPAAPLSKRPSVRPTYPGPPAARHWHSHVSLPETPLPPRHRPGEEARARHAPEASDSDHVYSRPGSGEQRGPTAGPAHTPSQPRPGPGLTTLSMPPGRHGSPGRQARGIGSPHSESEARCSPRARHQTVTGRARPWRQHSTCCSRSPAPCRRGFVRRCALPAARDQGGCDEACRAGPVAPSTRGRLNTGMGRAGRQCRSRCARARPSRPQTPPR